MALYHYDQRHPSGDKRLEERNFRNDSKASDWADALCTAWSIPVRCWKLGSDIACGPLFPSQTTPAKIIVCDSKPPRKKRTPECNKD